MKKKFLIGTIIGLVCILVFGAIYLSKKVDSKPQVAEFPSLKSGKVTIKEPLIMVPGSGGTADSYDTMIDQLKKDEKGVNWLKLTVDQKGKVTSQGNLHKTDKIPIVVIGFADSSDESVPAQGQWLGNAFQYLKKYYKFKKFNYLGHSNGGLIITYYLESHVKNGDPIPDKLMFLGAPFNGIEADENKLDNHNKLKTISSDLKPLLAAKNKLPRNIEVSNIYSNLEDDSDGIVPVESVKAGKMLYGHSREYEDHELKEKVAHAWLVENNTVFDEVETFFFQKKLRL
ncbi:alpha/beta fold hydrolase [Xylocopilactobacillus apis]|uniref:Alpha/beta hydrolase n=1 Tax=Xylocopilactobacillus apis TaxID=2932183 RepID=A0AAU9DKS7_9LACO|nr:alpha/beta fold hydrolase [Xylocopilactobacillus apis]BDR56119.1 hypothetical protein KIMC2_06810 [Xylocopilactobacillus apis]